MKKSIAIGFLLASSICHADPLTAVRISGSGITCDQGWSQFDRSGFWNNPGAFPLRITKVIMEILPEYQPPAPVAQYGMWILSAPIGSPWAPPFTDWRGFTDWGPTVYPGQPAALIQTVDFGNDYMLLEAGRKLHWQFNCGVGAYNTGFRSSWQTWIYYK